MLALAGSPEVALPFSEPQFPRLQRWGPNAYCTALKTGEGCLGSIPLPAFRPLQGQAEVGVEPPERCWRVGGGAVRSGALQAAAPSALPHLSAEREMHLDSRLGPARPASPRRPPHLHSQLPGPGPGRPAPSAWLAGQLASAALGARAGQSCPAGRPGMQGSRAPALSVWPALCLPDSGLSVRLSGSACLRLSEFGAVCESVSPCLIAVGLSGSAFLSVCLSGV